MNILVVDDDDQQRKLLKTGLTKKGYIVNDVYNGMECIDYVKKNTVDVIVIDYMMPVMDGLSAIRMLKANVKTKDIPIILMSSENVMSYGCSFIKKPFSISALINIIEETVNANLQKKILFS